MTEGRSRLRVSGPGPVSAPRRSDGEPYRFELIHDDGRWRCYADDHVALVAELIPGYDETPDHAEARLDFARRTRVHLQAALTVEHGIDGCTQEQVAVLLGRAGDPPAVPRWDAPVPIVLLANWYQPYTELPLPAEDSTGWIIWLDPTSDTSLLVSLHEAGVVVLNRRAEPQRG